MTIIEQSTMHSICNNLPRIAEALERIAEELKKANENKGDEDERNAK